MVKEKKEKKDVSYLSYLSTKVILQATDSTSMNVNTNRLYEIGADLARKHWTTADLAIWAGKMGCTQEEFSALDKGLNETARKLANG